MRRTDKGLTLIEVLIIVVMVGILLTIVYQKIRGRTTKDVIVLLKADVENAKAAEAEYFSMHNAWGTQAQLDSLHLLVETPGNTMAIKTTATGYTATATFLNSVPLICSVEVAGGEDAAKNAQTVCN